MTCEQVQRRLLGTESPESPAPEVVAHLAQCATCEQFQRRLQLLEEAVPLLPVSASHAKERLLNRILRKPEKTPQPSLDTVPFSSKRWPPRRLALAATAAVVFILGGFWFGSFLSTRQHMDPLAKGTPLPDVGAPAKTLTARLLDADLRLAEANVPRQRVEVLAELAFALHGETENLAAVASSKELLTLARLYEQVLREGVVARAKALPRDQRRQVLDPIADQLAKTERETRRRAGEVPQASAEPLLQVADAAGKADLQLRALIREGAAP